MTFGTGGKVTTDFGPGSNRAFAVAIQVDGKIVAAGGSGSGDFAIARYTTDGSLDPSFGAGGKVTTNIGVFDAAYSVAIQADGKIVAAGSTAPGGYCCQFALARYNPDGTLDTTFGSGGTLTTPFGGLTAASAVAIQTDGKIVAAGSVYSPSPLIDDFALARYNTDGSLDTSFGTGGKVTTDFGGVDAASGVAIQANGKIIAAGAGGPSSDFALARYNADGSLDTSFGTGGKVTTNFGGFDRANEVAIQADGKIVAAGVGGERFALARYNADGSLDTSFGTGGTVTTQFSGENIEGANGLALYADGKIVAAGSAVINSSRRFALARYNPDGSPDISFGNLGKVTTGFGSDAEAEAVAIQADGRIVAAGGTGACIPPCAFALARYLKLPTADLSLTKSDGVAEVVAGGSVTYTIVVSNSEPDAVIGATVTDNLPVEITGATWTCAVTGGGSCTPSGSGSINDTITLLVGATATYTLTGSIDPSARGSLSNTASVTAPPGVVDLDPTNNSATDTDTILPPADLAITKTDGQTTATRGSPVTYTIVASNAGPTGANGATVSDTLPGAITGATWTCVGATGGMCTLNGSGNINDTVNLPVGGTVTYTLTGTISPSATSPLTNTATVAVPPGVGDPNPGNNSVTDTDALLFVCGSEMVVVPDGRLVADVLVAGETRWFGTSLRIGSSYSLEFKNPAGTTVPGTLTVFSGDDGCSGTSTLVVTDTTTVEPGAGAVSRRVSFTAAGTETFFRARLVNAAGSPIPVSFTWSDTTMYSPAWSTNGTFNTFYSFQNTTTASLNGTLTLLDNAGAVLSTFSLPIPSGQTTTTNTQALAVTPNRTGTARFTHDGPPGSILAEAAIANFAISPAYVQPVKFQAVREAR